MKRITAFLTIIIFVLVSCGAQNEIKPPLWRAENGSGGELYIIGSIHLGDERLDTLPEYITETLNSADALAVEADVVSAMTRPAALMNAMKPMMYSDGSTIKDHISPELYDKARGALSEAGLYNAAMELYKPVMWMSTLDTLTYDKLGFDEDNGVDMQLLELAGELGKEIIEIESIEAQYLMLGSFSDDLQEILLEASCSSIGSDVAADELKGLLDSWCGGDVAALEAAVLSDISEAESEEEAALLEEYNNGMIHERNLLMSDYAEEALNSGKKVFICVGAAHVIGETGILKTLEARGYRVEQIH